MESRQVPQNREEAEHLITELSENYTILRNHTRVGFWFAITFMGLGLVVIYVGAFGELFGLTVAGSNLAATSGVLLEAVSGTAIWIYRTNSKKLNLLSTRLDSTLRILTAFQQIEQLPEYEKNKERVKLIGKLTN